MESTPRPVFFSLFLLSAATLTFEVDLTRLFSVAQFYHFAFMIVSVALLGFGASGAFLALRPGAGREAPERSLAWLALGCGLSILGALLLTNHLPFDSFSIAWDRRQVGILVLHYLFLALPFFFSGMAVGLLLSASPLTAGRTYAVNLFGSALGCLVALLAPARLGGEGTAVLGSALAGAAAIVAAGGARRETKDGRRRTEAFPKSRGRFLSVVLLSAGALLLVTGFDLGLRLAGGVGLAPFELRLSPYKGLSTVLRQPGAEVLYRRWNSFSRVDLVRSAAIHSLPGLSYRYLQPPPAEDGLLVDGDDLSPVLRRRADLAFTGYLPAAAAFQMRPAAQVLVLEPRGGLDVITALALGAGQVTAVEANPLIVAAAPEVYQDPRVRVVIESDRSYTRRTRERYGIIILSLAASYHPVRSGAYSLAEDYRYTVEAFEDALARLEPGGLLVVTRWLQDPPSEELRAFALAVTALERQGARPGEQIVALRGYNTATLLVKNGVFDAAELQAVRSFAAERAFDLVYTPDLQPGEANRYNVLPEPVYVQAFTALLNTTPRQSFYDTYPFEVSPPSDDRPFFGHFFKWSQARQVLAELGMTWQPFGGAGYFVILALLALALVSAAVLILLPVAATRRGPVSPGLAPGTSGPDLQAAGFGSLRVLLYFGLIGLAFLLVEIPLIQRFILFLGHPAYAVTAVLFALLLFSGLGSHWSSRLPHRPALAVLVLLLAGLPALLPPLFELSLGLPLSLRLILAVVVLAPAGFLMGLPFPVGIARLRRAELVRWAWAVNGAASVVASVLAALLALSFGFTRVLALGALLYGAAWLTLFIPRSKSPPR